MSASSASLRLPDGSTVRLESDTTGDAGSPGVRLEPDRAGVAATFAAARAAWAARDGGFDAGAVRGADIVGRMAGGGALRCGDGFSGSVRREPDPDTVPAIRSSIGTSLRR